MPKTGSLTGTRETEDCVRKFRSIQKERTSKGSAGPFIEALRKGSVEPQYENGIRGNANFDSADPDGSKSEKFVREI